MSLSVPHSRGEVAGVAGFLGLRVDHPGPASSKICNYNFSVTVIRHNFQIYFCGKLSASALPSTVAMQSSGADWDEPQSSRIACQPSVPARASHSFVDAQFGKKETGNEKLETTARGSLKSKKTRHGSGLNCTPLYGASSL